MRIKKTTDTGLELGVLGKVKTGKKDPSTGYPMSLDHFVFTSNESRRVEKLKKLLGDKPTSISITFASNDIDKVCSQYYELRDKSGSLVAKGDGENFKQSTAKGWVFLDKEDCKKLATSLNTDKYKAAWKEILVMRFIILEYDEFGAWEFRTGGKDTSIKQIIDTFDMVLKNAGRVTMIPFNLTVRKHKSNRAGVNRQYPIVNLVPVNNIESQEKIKELGDSLSGLLTAEKVEQALLPPPTPTEIEETQYEEVKS